MRRELAELAGLGRGRVRLGATPTPCASLVAETLGIFHTALTHTTSIARVAGLAPTAAVEVMEQRRW